jgi:hypothetical protein
MQSEATRMQRRCKVRSNRRQRPQAHMKSLLFNSKTKDSYIILLTCCYTLYTNGLVSLCMYVITVVDSYVCHIELHDALAVCIL